MYTPAPRPTTRTYMPEISAITKRLAELQKQLDMCYMDIHEQDSTLFSACVRLWDKYDMYAKVAYSVAEWFDLWFDHTVKGNDG